MWLKITLVVPPKGCKPNFHWNIQWLIDSWALYVALYFMKREYGQVKKIILYQGVMNPGRGLEEMIAAMPFVESAILLIIGFGKVEEGLKELVKKP